ncbi:MAG: DUF1501 domain-containing protein [Planctomycetaceae bacterium]
MLSICRRASTSCSGFSRRDLLQIGGLSAFGLAMPHRLSGQEAGGDSANPVNRRAKSCIVLWMTGGPPQHEPWDPKPDSPAEIRGPFGTIVSNVAGTFVGELMPRTAQMLDRICVLRGVHTDNPSHPGSSYEMLTGTLHRMGKGRDDIEASRSDSPSLSAVVKQFMTPLTGIPTSVVLPQPIFNVPFYPGQDGGFLGPQADPWRLTCNPLAEDFRIDELTLPDGVSLARLTERRNLLDHVARHFDESLRGQVPERFNRLAEEAFGLISGSRVRTAFDLTGESADVRDRYGRHMFGQGCLLARRLVEAGVTLVQLNWHREPNDETPMWDSHWQIESDLKVKLMPPMDQGYTALLEDLENRGLLTETLVVWMGEFGRTPKLEYIAPHPTPGRNHWGNCFSVALAGAGVRGGHVYGASDQDGAYPSHAPVGPEDLTATLFDSLGLAPETEMRDRLDRPHPLSRGRVLHELF